MKRNRKSKYFFVITYSYRGLRGESILYDLELKTKDKVKAETEYNRLKYFYETSTFLVTLVEASNWTEAKRKVRMIAGQD